MDRDPLPTEESPLRALVTPRMLGVHVIGVLAVTIAMLAGFWQFEAWQERRAAEARDLSQATPVALLSVMDGDDPFPGDHVGQPVELSGQWRVAETFFVADREDPRTQADAELGWWIVTPVAVDGTDSAIPVVRGWVDTPRDQAPPSAMSVEVTGWLQPPEGSGLTDEDPTDDVLPELRIASLTQRVGIDLFSGYVVAETIDGVRLTSDTLPAAVGAHDLPEVGIFTALRNLLYAIEWWVFGLFAAFIWWRFGRDEVIAARELAEGEQPAPDPVGSTT